MKQISIFVGLVGLWVLPASGQETPPAKIDVTDLKFQAQQTPQIQAGGVIEKRWRPKSWLELDMEFDIKVPQSEGGRRGSLDSITVNYYVALNQRTKDNKTEVLKGSFNYVDIPAAETCHALAYVSPATLRRILQKENFTAAADVQAVACEVLVNGQRLGGKSSRAGAWWEMTETISINDGTMLSKQDTPFAILWGDYDVLVKKQ